MKSRSIVVIGAGVGGIAAAARLAREGMHVTVFEKNPRPGGRCDRFTREGHTFDTGPTLFIMPQGVSKTLMPSFPSFSWSVSPFVAIPPSFDTSNISPYSRPKPKVPEAPMTGFLNSTPQILTLVIYYKLLS
jgi:cation diffusion facilitator CzcD-associated flavoprotein CzcO